MKRVEYLDVARALAMFAVYYGHFIERLFREGGVEPALLHWKFVYSFHIPFFFFLSGVFWKPAPFSSELFLRKLKTRLVPVLFFSLLILPLWISLDYKRFVKIALRGEYLSGHPTFNMVLWFLVCFMVAEWLAALVVKYLKIDSKRLFAYALLSLAFGYYVLVLQRGRVETHFGFNPRAWYLGDAFIALAFYFFGYLSKNALTRLSEPWGWTLGLIAAPLLFFLTWYLHGLNATEDGVILVVMSASTYGNVWYFLLAALAGSAFLLSLSRVLNLKWRILHFIGRNTLIFLGLNGIGFHFADAFFIAHSPWLPETSLGVFLFGAGYAAASLLLTSPLVWAFRRWIPELCGYEWTPTSILPPMSGWLDGKVGAFFKAHLVN